MRQSERHSHKQQVTVLTTKEYLNCVVGRFTSFLLSAFLCYNKITHSMNRSYGMWPLGIQEFECESLIWSSFLFAY